MLVGKCTACRELGEHMCMQMGCRPIDRKLAIPDRYGREWVRLLLGLVAVVEYMTEGRWDPVEKGRGSRSPSEGPSKAGHNYRSAAEALRGAWESRRIELV